MNVTAPEWLSKRGGSLKTGYDQHTCLMILRGEPQYALVPAPASGKYSCLITQTINSRHVPASGTFPTPEDAIRGGLEDLRKHLGW